MTDNSSQILTKTCFGHSIYVKKNDSIGRRIIHKGIYDKPGTYFMRAALAQMDKPVILDIGANIGNHLISMSPFAAQAYGFEPQQDLYKMINKSLSLNEITNCKIFPFGLSDTDEELTFYVNKSGNVGASSFIKEQVKGENKTEILSVRHGDHVMEEIGLTKLDFIKVDVEGFELNVFRGLEKTISQHAPMIAMEWDSLKTINDFKTNHIFENLLSGYNVLGLIAKHGDQYWKGKPFWKLQKLVSKLDMMRKWRMIDFDPNRRYANIILYKDHHSPIIEKIRDSRI